ncbi:MAG: hypothetical protein ACOYM2_19250 [Rectinemataceae bacterium]
MNGIGLDDRIYLELTLSKAIETDEHGNWIIEAEASNENLDFDGQVVLQRALSGSKDYFLSNGVISYDHRHLRADPEDPNWSPEKYIIGEPIDVTTRGDSTFVTAKLYKSNAVAREVIKKLQDGSTRMKTSVGGKRPEIVSTFDSGLGRAVEKVVRVLWDELAITFKPVNQTLEPVALSSAAFVKSLEAGFATDSSAMTGGRAMIPSDLGGGRGRKADVYAVVMALAYGDVSNDEEAEQLLKNRGCSPEEAKTILRDLISKKDRIKEEVSMTDPNLTKAFDESIETLEKSMKKPKKAATEPDGDEEGFPEFPPEEAQEAEADEGEDPDEEGDVPPPKPPKKKGMQKSVYEEMRESSSDFLDVTPFLDNLTKSISKRLSAMERQVSEMVTFQKSMGGALVNTGKLVKSMADGPMPRQAVVNKQDRAFTGSDGKPATMTRQEIIQKSQQAVREGKMSLQDAAIIEERLNKGIALNDGTLRLIKSI